METTLELRWFLEGTSPAIVRKWFESMCPGKIIPETDCREDLYIYQNQADYLNKFTDINLDSKNPEEINLKLRQGSLELKLMQQQWGTHTTQNYGDRITWMGKVEQWCKLSLQQPNDSTSFSYDSAKADGILVKKKRSQKLERGVKSELTQLETKDKSWWSIAFEMPLEHINYDRVNFFRESVERVAQTYCGPELLVDNSYGYSHWLLDVVLMPKDYRNRFKT